MGWTCTTREKGESTNLEWFRNELGHGKVMPSGGTYELLDLAQGPRFVQYGAWRIPDGRVVGLVILTSWRLNERFNYCWKEMDESMGPSEDECPDRILDLLTPHDGRENEYARDWRIRAEYNRAKRRSRPRLTKGTRVRFADKMRFTDGTEADTFEFVKRNTFRQIVPLDFTPQIGEPWMYGSRVSISGWSSRPYEVVS